MKQVKNDLKFEVKQCHIDAGKRGKPSECPTALAIKEQEQDFDFVSVSWDIIQLRKNEDWFTYDIPEELQNFIVHFDEGKKVSEESFVCRLQEEW